MKIKKIKNYKEPFKRNMPYVEEASKDKLHKEAANPDQKIKSIEKDVKDIKTDIKFLNREVKKIAKQIDGLNIGNRRFWQQATIFNSLQRKIERLEKLEKEWVKFKKEIDVDIRRQIERGTRAQIQTLKGNSESWYKEGMSIRGTATVKVIMNGKEQIIEIPCNPATDNKKSISEQVLMHYPVEKIVSVDIKEDK